MRIRYESKPETRDSPRSAELENPMQEFSLKQVAESVEETTVAIFEARKLEVQQGAGQAAALLFVP